MSSSLDDSSLADCEKDCHANFHNIHITVMTIVIAKFQSIHLTVIARGEERGEARSSLPW